MANGASCGWRLLIDSPLRNRRSGIPITAALGGTIGLGVLSLSTIFTAAPLAALMVYLIALVLCAFASLPALALLWYLDRREREVPWVFFGALLWGAVVATGLSLILNGLGFATIAAFFDDFYGAEQAAHGTIDTRILSRVVAAALVGPPVEEIMKGLALLLIMWLLRNEFDNMRDGIVYGGLVGLGFNLLEAPFYIMSGYLESGVAPYAHQIAGRFVFLGVNGHLLFSALFGAGLGLARQLRRRGVKALVALAGLGAAILAHMVNNSILSWTLPLMVALLGGDLTGELTDVPLGLWWAAVALGNLIFQPVAYLLLIAALLVSARWERRVIREQLAGEVGGAITPAEYEQVKAEGLFSLRRLPGYDRKLSRAIINAQNELAFRKQAVAQRGGDPEHDRLVAAWRADIARLRQAASPPPVPS